ncbi:MAG TPA: CDP-diacylglycerol--glycerol-3-phosphate 3-phosphatidyltransferase [Acetivibrio sp.]|jgi:CDP-diacylglycerol--glycerol-3-phosphate 3-phosphatidyltransferase|nr:CDP-diacylglycerol--glycerol-3-phosphate 3-phosphatidyltransferase [Clostridium sp.]HQA58706.1 CDP-diacylglycerol--glycerol-3-phosphate 3-phosphatidyltransferase [Acetivibrio sp.]
MNLPNKLTISRILLVPIFLLIIVPIPDWIINSSFLSFMSPQLEAVNHFIKNYGNYIAAFLFFVAASTDGLDGYIARKRKQVTRFGKFLDPIADKLLVAAALIALVERDELSTWAAVIIIGREFMITGLRLVAASDGIVIAASKWGKIKTVTQIIAILAVLMKYYVNKLFGFPLEMYLMFIAIVATIYSAYDYIVKNAHVIDLNQ